MSTTSMAEDLELDSQGAIEHESQTSELAAFEGSILLDYFRVRFEDTRDVWQGLDTWLDKRSARACGWRGWYDRSASVLDGGIIAWCTDDVAKERQGVLLDLPGKACASLGDRLVPFFKWAMDNGTATRIDWAADDRQGLITLDRITEAKRTGGIVTRWRDFRVIQDWGEREVEGWTVYLGARRYEAMLRIYDKAAEQRRKGRKVEGPWVRLELETKGKFADRLAREYLSKGSGAILGQITRRVRFCEPGTDSNKRRWKACAWWLSFVGSVRPGPSLLCGEKPECTIQRLAAWVEKQAGPALAALLTADLGDLTRFIEIAERGRFRLRSKHYAALAAVGVA